MLGEGPVLKCPHFKKPFSAGQKMVAFFIKIFIYLLWEDLEVAQQSTVVFPDELSGWRVESQR